MSSRDLYHACWRCTYWGGLVAGAHANCTRLNASLQADPATGCAYWTAGAGDALPADWLPDGFKLREKTVIWSKPTPASERVPSRADDQRPGTPSEALKWDQDQECNAWRATDALLARLGRRD